MQENSKIDIAIEVLANRTAGIMRKIKETDDKLQKEKMKEELNELLEDRRKMYSGDKEVIRKIIERDVKNG